MKLDFILHTIDKAREEKGYNPNTITFNPIDWFELEKKFNNKTGNIRPLLYISGLKIVVDEQQKEGVFLIQEL